MDTKEMASRMETLGKDWEDFKDANNKRLDALEKDRGTAEFEEKLEKIEKSIAAAVSEKEQHERAEQALQEKIDGLERKLDLMGSDDSKVERKELRDYRQTFDKYLRSFVDFGGKQGNPELLNELRQMEKQIPEMQYKDFSTTTSAAGGAAVPTLLGREIHDQVRLISPVRDLVRTVMVGSPDYSELVNVHGEASTWVGEGTSRSKTASSAFRKRSPTKGTLYAYPQASEESLQDMFFDVGAFIRDVTAQEFAYQEETAILTGSGTNKPTGILNGTPVTTDDDASPQRSAEVIEYVHVGKNSPVSAFDPDQLITLQHTLRTQYRMRAVWTMASPTMGAIRRVADTTGQYLWQPSLQAGVPDMLLGNAVRLLENAAAVALGAYPILFGDFKRGYLFIIVGGVRLTVDDNITAPGFVNWYIRERVGGILLDNNAIKAGKYDDN